MPQHNILCTPHKKTMDINKLFAIVFTSTVLCFLLWVSCGHCAEIPKEQAVKAIIGEFENDNMLAGACSLRIRGDLRGVYGLKAKRVTEKRYSLKTYNKAVYAWFKSQDAKECAFIGGAEHWLSVQDMKRRPGWSYSCEMTYFSGKTYFFKCNK